MTTKKTTPAEDRLEQFFALGPDGTRLYVRKRTGPRALTAILSDGIVCDGFIYKYLWDDLAAWVSVAHWHYRGHGRSALPVDSERIDVRAHADDLDAVRRELGDPPAVLIGHSFGTQVCLEAYRKRRDRVAAMVLMCGSFGRVTHTFRGTDLLANVLPNLLAFVGQHPKLARALWSRMPVRAAVKVAQLTGDINAKSIRVEDIEPYFRHAAHVDFAMFLRMLQYAGEHSAEDFLGDVAVPVLVVAGERDSFTPPYMAEAMARAIPGAELCVLPGSTHVAPLERREEVASRIGVFLRESVGIAP